MTERHAVRRVLVACCAIIGHVSVLRPVMLVVAAVTLLFVRRV